MQILRNSRMTPKQKRRWKKNKKCKPIKINRMMIQVLKKVMTRKIRNKKRRNKNGILNQIVALKYPQKEGSIE